jgi:hypothetical protein
MIEIDGKIVSTDIITEKFLCDLGRCRGICCVEGNAGAPLEPEEVLDLTTQYADYKRFMTPEGIAEIERQGFSTVDPDGDLVTPLVGDAECAFSYSEGGVTLCAIEKAGLQKPISCHLYPIRVTRFGDGSLGLNYHRWAVCDGARQLGREKGVPLYKMLRQAIVRRFGEEFFEALEAAEKYLERSGQSRP